MTNGAASELAIPDVGEYMLARVDTLNFDDDVHALSILIVDDEPANVRLLKRILQRLGYRRIYTATNGLAALAQAQLVPPDILLLDLHMPELNGLTLMRELGRMNPEGYPLVLVLTGDDSQRAKQDVLSAGARDFVVKPFDTTEVGLRIKNLAELRLTHKRLQRTNGELEARITERTIQLEKAHLEVLERLAMAAEFRDDETGQHTRRVGALAARLAFASGLSEETSELIARTAPLHDVGKIAIPDHVLLKPGPLDHDELKLMRTHTSIGARLLAGGHSSMVATACDIALSHHERWDGTGYPNGLAGDEIPLCGRIVAIADFFDALSHDRPYRGRFDPVRIMEMIRTGRGKHFDPTLVDAFFTLPEMKQLRLS